MSFSLPAFAKPGWWPALVTMVLWGAVAVGGVFWVFHFPQGPSALPAGPTQARVPGDGSGGDATAPMLRAWGVSTPAADAGTTPSGRYQLWGVVAGASGQGSALIAIDGQAPKAYRVGQALSEGVYLQSLSPRQARIGASAQGPDLFVLTLPVRDKAP